jgi:hypothetical protein
MGMLEDIKRNFRTAVDRQDQESQMYARGEINPLQYGLRTAGNTVDATLGNVVGTATDYLVPDGVEEAVSQAIMNSPPGVFQDHLQLGKKLATEYPEQARDLSAGLSVAESVPFVRGMTTAAKAGRRVDELTGEDSGRGMLLSSANNVIPGYYGPEKAASVAAWVPNQVIGTVRDMASPDSRAKYREQGITTSSQQIMQRAREGATSKLETFIYNLPPFKSLKRGKDIEKGTARAIAQGQYLGRIHEQSGRRGKAVALGEVMRRSDVAEVVDYYPGAYADSVRNNRLKPYPKDSEGQKKKMPLKMSNEDLDFIEDHFSTVWTEPSQRIGGGPEVSFKDAETPILAIKNPGDGRSTTGRHHMDVLYNAPFVSKAKKIFEGRNNVSPDELFSLLNAEAAVSQGLKDERKRYSVKGQAADGGVWITGSRPGSAITEGGINYLVKVTTDGKLIGVMSDEHNLFEGIAGKIQEKTGGLVPTLRAMKHLIPNRLIAVTPPMVKDLKGGKYAHPVGKSDGRKYEEVVDEIVNFQPSDAVLKAEQQRQRGMLTTAASAAVMGQTQGEEVGR